MTKLHNESGRSMVEMLGVIAIIGVITIGSISATSYMNSYFKINNVVAEVDQLAMDIADLYSWSDYYGSKTGGSNMEYLCGEDVLMCDSNNSVTNMWGGAVDVKGFVDTTGDEDLPYFTIEYDDISESACEQICYLGIDGAFQNVTVHINNGNINDTTCDPENAGNEVITGCTENNKITFIGY